MSARADFVCNSRACAKGKNAAAPVYELPVKAVRCPVCGRKSLRRLYNSVNVNLGAKPTRAFDGRHTSSSMAQRLDALVEEPVSEALAKRDELKKAALPYRHDGPPGMRWKNDNGMVRSVAPNRLGHALREVYNTGELSTGASVPVGTGGELGKKAELKYGGDMPGILKDLQSSGRPPTGVVARDTSRLVQGADGSVQGVLGEAQR